VFFFSSRRRHTRSKRDWSSTCALPISGIEVDVDAISDGETTIVPGIMEHIERSGVHSGDSIAVYPPQRLSDDVKRELCETTDKRSEERRVGKECRYRWRVQRADRKGAG